MAITKTSIQLPFYARLALVLLSVLLIIIFLEQGKAIFVPLVFALLIAILLYPLARFFERRLKMGRGGSAISSLLIFITLLTAFIYFLTQQIINFTHDIPDLKVRFKHVFADMHHWVYTQFHINTAQQTDYINKYATGFVESGAQSVSNIFLSLTSILFLIVFVFIFTFFILFHRQLLVRFTLKLFNVKHQEKVNEVIGETKSMINSYIAGLLIEIAVMSVANTALLLILGIEYAVLLGIVAAVLNIIPYLGIYTAIALTMFFTFASASGSLALEVGIGLFILHFLDSNILMPRIVGAKVKMNPFITVIAVIVGEFVWGIPGMFLFIPITGIVKMICERVEGLEAWGILIGVDDTVIKSNKKLVVNTTTEAVAVTTDDVTSEKQ